MKKKLLTIFATLFVCFSLALGFSACEEKHTHTYTETVTAATCTDQGYTTYTCECGKSYIEYDGLPDYTKHTIDESGWCTVCNRPLNPTEGVLYEVSADGTHAEVIGYTGTSRSVNIANSYNNLPVTNIVSHSFNIWPDPLHMDSRIYSIAIPDSITSIDEDAFFCPGVSTVGHIKLGSLYITDLASWWNISNGRPFHWSMSLYLDNKLVTEFIIPDGVTSIDGMFMYCSSLTSITIPDSVTSIGGNAFYNCDSLTSITIPDGVTSIGGAAFYGCSNLTSITIPDSVTSIGNYAFYGCSNLTSITIPDSVTSIGNYAFYGCSSLTSVTIPDSVTSIGEEAFYDCRNLTSVTIGNSVTSIGANAFKDCGKLIFNDYENAKYLGCHDNPFYALIELNSKNYSTYMIHSDTKVLTCESFSNCGRLTNIVIPDSVTSIGSGAFRDCSGLTSVTIGSSVTSIGSEAFSGCSSLTSVTIPDSVMSIGDSAFSGCSSLTSATIGNSVESIGSYAFDDCKSLTSIIIPDSVTSIDNFAFDNCRGLTIYCEATSKPSSWNSSWNVSNCPVVWDCNNKDVASDGYIYVVIDNIRYGIKDGAATVARQARNIQTANIPTSITYKNYEYSVTSIGSYAFYDCNNLTSVTIGNSVTSIYNQAFYNCSSLTSVYYSGTAEDWAKISIVSYNTALTNATRYYYSENEPTLNSAGTAYNGNYWRYVDGVATPWVYTKEE